MDKEALKRFYFSQSGSFGPFKAALEKQQSAAPRRVPTPLSDPVTTPGPLVESTTQHAAPVSMGDISVSVIDPTTSNSTSPVTQTVAAVGITGLRSMKPKSLTTTTTTKSTTDSSALRPPDAATAEYFNFLKQQQELQAHHHRIESALSELADGRRHEQAALAKTRREASELLKNIEDSADWKLYSKYNIKQLSRDANLSLELVELVEDVPPHVEGINRLEQELSRIRTQYNGSPSFTHQQLFVDQAIRRLGMLQKVLSEGNMDSTELSRIPETLVVHLEKVAALPSLESLVSTAEAAIERATFKLEQDRRERAVAIEDGEVHVAEKLCYSILDHHETMLEHALSKVGSLDRALSETAVLEEVRAKYHSQTFGEFDRINKRCTALKTRCEDDIKKMFALREKVEEVEALAAQKVQEDRQRNEVMLVENSKKCDVVFAKMDELEKELESLEKERHRLVQQRIAAKDKDEHRRAEFAQFCKTVDDHLIPIERSIRNMDIFMHSAEIIAEFVHAGFQSLQEELAERSNLLSDVKLESQKQHVEVFRGLLLELGEVVYRKERMVEETDRSIQQAHIQQELLAETFNPNAKKFGDVKKRLLLARDDLENDIKDLKERAAAALRAFVPTEMALTKAGVEFVHPVTEQEQHTLALRTRMVEFKAIAAGHVEGQSVLNDIASLKQEIDESRKDVEAINASTSGTINKTLPLIRAAQKARGV